MALDVISFVIGWRSCLETCEISSRQVFTLPGLKHQTLGSGADQLVLAPDVV